MIQIISNNKNHGFTLLETLVVISIVGILVSMGIVAISIARQNARTTRAEADLRSLRNAIYLLQSDTTRWPNGCPPEEVANPEVNLNTSQAGLILPPVVGNQGDGCRWTQDNLNGWKGPYIDRVVDPWGHDYYFDPDYQAYDNCNSKPVHDIAAAVISFGPNGVGLNSYDCDDIFLELN